MKINFHYLGSDDETRCFEFFRYRTSLQLAGFFSSEFWSNLVLRAAFHEPVIKHAILALSSLHERFSNGDETILYTRWNKSEGGFALVQYNQAIKHLVKHLNEGRQAIDVCLIACMLFSSFEVSRPQGTKTSVEKLTQCSSRHSEVITEVRCATSAAGSRSFQKSIQMSTAPAIQVS